MGLLPTGDDRGAGELFVGDGTRTEGWYRAWASDGFTVVTCDFTVLEDMLFSIDTRRYLAVRGPAHGGGGPAAIAYIETREGRVTTPVPAGTHFAYAEVEYFDGVVREAFRGLGWNAVEDISRTIAAMRGEVGWSPGVLRALSAIAETDPGSSGAALVYEGQAKVLLGSLVGTVTTALPSASSDRRGILAAIALANERWREGVDQREAADAAGMGLTKFKRLFRQATGTSLAAYIGECRMREARTLLERGKSVAEAARSSGYRSPTSFSAAFERAVGMTPGRYREAAVVRAEEVSQARL